MTSDNSKYGLLNTITVPADMRKLRLEQLPQLCDELRAFIIDVLSENPGHFASSLGTVELTVALHYVYDTPVDRIVWDVGHQAYGHKILTGRRERFHTNRKFGGIKPFPSPEESEYDTFACGHASNSISAALGLAVAANSTGKSHRHVVAVIGDGSMSGGLSFEGLNNAGAVKNDMLIVLNDNNMSIDNSVGGLKNYLHRLHTSESYNRIRYGVTRRLLSWGWLNDKRRRALIRFNNSLKSLLRGQQNVFEGMDIRYFGPVDGHDVIGLVKTLRRIKDMQGPKMLHISTVKGHGFKPAEEDPRVWHAPGRFDCDTGERIKEGDGAELPPRYQDVFGYTLLELARQNPRIVGVTPAMPTGCSMNIMMEAMPDRTFDVGIAEGHAVTFSAGMAKDGLMPFCNIYSSFAQRAYDNVIHDVALLHLDMVLCLDRAGIVGEDGPTHHGVLDIPSLRAVPGITIASPMCETELRNMMYTAQLPGHGPFVIRYPRGRGEEIDWQKPMQEIEVGHGRILRRGGDVAVLSLGPIGNTVKRAIKHSGRDAWHVDMRFAKPLDTAILDEVAAHCRRIVTVEDGARAGGFGSAVLEYLSDKGYKCEVSRLGLPDAFVPHGSPDELYRLVGLDEESIIKSL